jgi:hypothetical protein
METKYVSFNPPRACAVEMTRGPWFLRSFSGSWRFDRVGQGVTRVTFTYSLVGRPAFLSGLLRLAFAREARRRLEAFAFEWSVMRHRKTPGGGVAQR